MGTATAAGQDRQKRGQSEHGSGTPLHYGDMTMVLATGKHDEKRSFPQSI
jgi:hypothetical protein